MQFEDPELVAEFVVEANEHLRDIENQLLEIEASGADINVDLVNTVFRGVHSIKGAAGFLGLESLKLLAHSLEGVLNLMREGTLVPTSPIVDVMLRSADQLRGMVATIETSNEVDVSELAAALDAIAAGNEAPAPVQQREEFRESVAETNVASEQTTPAVDPIDVPSSEPIVESVPTAPVANTPNPASASKKGTPSASPSVSAETNIRVSVDVLDQLMNLAGELVLGRNQLLQVTSTPEHLGLDGVASHLDQVTSELQDAIMQTRMQPIGSVFGRFSRVVRDLSSQLSKKCDLVLEGQDVEVDKTISEAIGDPLTHLVRNSVDHGIELPADRVAVGKPDAGTLRLSARHQSGKVRIEISDDGAGIDAETLKAKAVSKGLITQEQALSMTEREAVRLIFHPGFSMAAAVTDVSGRGVGMDVVRSNIERLGGVVEIETTIGKGTAIHITLPLTLAIIPSLIVRCSDNRFAIPQVNIAELVRIRPAEIAARIGQVKNAEVLRLRGTLLPLVRLNDCLDMERLDDRLEALVDAEDAINIIVVETGKLRYGLVVDGLFDSEEIVVKPLGQHVKSCPCLSGATILGDGRVALILDVPGIATKSNLRQRQDDQQLAADGSNNDSHDSTEQQPVLLFTSHPEEQFAVPMPMVARIERVHRDQLDSVGGQELLQYRGASLPLMRLENLITAKPQQERERLFVIVFEAAGHEIGLIAPQLVDIRNVSAEFDSMTFGEEGVCGAQVIDDRTTRALDLLSLAHKSRPEWFAKNEPVISATAALNTPSPITPATKTILLAEDSTFFRRQVTSFLEDEGYRVVGCEDGRVAWHTLKSGHEDIDLLLTDIEMPNMNGLELSRHVKDDENLQHIPVIALTSLAGQEDERRGREAGVDDYQVKLDRANLLKAVLRFAPIGVCQSVGSTE
ncbi:MAG: chemotaxis protein CheW [Planctomycetes bacterium]|nr:chemotaxis protein CheW [Planctomycetota bacterium]